MKVKSDDGSCLRAGGKEQWEATEEYSARVRKIVTEVKDAYAPRIMSERNAFKRLRLRIQRFFEIQRKVEALSSSRNLHLNSGFVFG